MRKRDYFTIPNLMGYFRILIIPVFLWLYYHAESTREYVVSFVVLFMSYLTDFFDGKIARKLNCVTDFGKMLDPFADKLTQCAIAVAVLFKVPNVKYFLILFVCKEFYMGVMGLYILKKYNVLHGAQMYGKVYTWVVDFGIMALSFFTNMAENISNGIIIFMILVLIVTWILYLKFHLNVIKEAKKKVA